MIELARNWFNFINKLEEGRFILQLVMLTIKCSDKKLKWLLWISPGPEKKKKFLGWS